MTETPQSTQRAHARTLARPRARKPLTWERTFYRSLRRHGTIMRACADAKIARMTWYDAVARHPDMAERADDALEAFADLLEAEAVRRGVHGVEEPYQVRGGVLTTVTRYSDRLLEILLKAKRPRQYREAPGVLVGGKDISVFTMDFERPTLPKPAEKKTGDNEQTVFGDSDRWRGVAYPTTAPVPLLARIASGA